MLVRQHELQHEKLWNGRRTGSPSDLFEPLSEAYRQKWQAKFRSDLYINVTYMTEEQNLEQFKTSNWTKQNFCAFWQSSISCCFLKQTENRKPFSSILQVTFILQCHTVSHLWQQWEENRKMDERIGKPGVVKRKHNKGERGKEKKALQEIIK